MNSKQQPPRLYRLMGSTDELMAIFMNCRAREEAIPIRAGSSRSPLKICSINNFSASRNTHRATTSEHLDYRFPTFRVKQPVKCGMPFLVFARCIAVCARFSRSRQISVESISSHITCVSLGGADRYSPSVFHHADGPRHAAALAAWQHEQIFGFCR